VAKVKVINSNLNENLNDGVNFSNTPSQTIFSFGNFTVTSNFDNRKYIDYSTQLNSFVESVTLINLGLNNTQSSIIENYSTTAVLNLDKSNMNTFIRFGSAYEFFRVSIEDIILGFPGSLFLNSQKTIGTNVTFFDLVYDSTLNISTFKIPINSIDNPFNLVYNYGNISEPDNVKLKNLNLSFDDYIVWVSQNSNINNSTILGYTGNSSGRNYLMIKCNNNPFSGITSGTTAPINFHLKPNNIIFEEYREQLNQYEKYIISTRDSTNGFKFIIKEPRLLEDGSITYSDVSLLWETSDDYNIDINTSSYDKFIEGVLTIGAKYDAIKTDLVARFLTPTSLKDYDETEEKKMTKLLRVYGWEFDRLREFIDSLVYINKISYDKINNIPDQLIKNMSRTFGWNYFSLINETTLVESLFNIDDSERDLSVDLLPSEINIELWRRILLNTNYFWKSKGTRQAIKSIFLMVGIPEQFIDITEYVYTVEGKINPNTVALEIGDFPSNSLPYDTSGYPISPLETNDFYFQISGNSDSGQEYMNVFRDAGFNLQRTVDNKKSWVESGATYRIDDTTPQYYQEDSKLVINTKEIDVSLDTARGIEVDVYDYILTDYAVNSSGYTLQHSFVNLSLGVGGSQSIFTLPYNLDDIQGDFEVRYNGILLNAPKTGTTTGITSQSDYSITGNSFTVNLPAINLGNRRDVIQTTLITTGGTSPISGITVDYVVTRVNANAAGTIVPLPSQPKGDVQVTINGIALTKGTNQFNADYIVDEVNSQLIIQNIDVITYLSANPTVQVAYIEVTGTEDISARTEIHRVDSYSSTKLYFNQAANKFVYKLNYKASSAQDLKILIDGIALESGNDYTINQQNQFEVFLPKGIRYGNIISIYYLVGDTDIYNPIIDSSFGIGDISELSFLEFIELIQKRMINVKNRKIISDFKGGWYPSLFKVYVDYIKRGFLSDSDTLKSNGYTFENLYNFLSKYNSFFEHFINQLIPSTVILRRSGLVVRNSIFTKQKFMYRRGVNLYDNNIPVDIYGNYTDIRGDWMYEYLGSDGAIFKIRQLVLPPTPPPPLLYVETVTGILTDNTSNNPSTIDLTTGGERILGINDIDSYGIIYRSLNNIGFSSLWAELETVGVLTEDNFSTVISNVTEGLTYEFKAFVRAGVYFTGYTGNTLSIEVPVTVNPSLETKEGVADLDSIDNTGGKNIEGYNVAEYYGMQYRPVGSGDAEIYISPTAITTTEQASIQTITITGDSWNTYSATTVATWLTPQIPQVLSSGGIETTINVGYNAQTTSRKEIVCYTPFVGETKCVEICQGTSFIAQTIKYVDILPRDVITQLNYEQRKGLIQTTPIMGQGESFDLSLCWTVNSTTSAIHNINISCNSVLIYNNTVNTTTFEKNGLVDTINVTNNDTIIVCVDTLANASGVSTALLSIQTVTTTGNDGGITFVIGEVPTYQISLGARAFNNSGGILPID